MKQNKPHKDFLKQIRAIRDELNLEIKYMTLEEERLFIQNSIEESKASRKAMQLKKV